MMALILMLCLVLDSVFGQIPPSQNLKVNFYLFNRDNIVKPIELLVNTYSKLNSTKSTKFLIHGWLESYEKEWYQQMTAEYLKKDDYNVVQVDWSEPASEIYTVSMRNTRKVGDTIGDVIVSLRLPLRNVHVIGHSLGAHVSGNAGDRIYRVLGEKISRITALDAAGPGFEGPLRMRRLSKDDAILVDMIHTDAGVFGLKTSVGTVDFYPNGGVRPQPNCSFPGIFLRPFDDVFQIILCSHHMSYHYFIQSINMVTFKGVKCAKWLDYLQDKCATLDVAVMGDGYVYEPNLTGKFFLDVQ